MSEITIITAASLAESAQREIDSRTPTVLHDSSDQRGHQAHGNGLGYGSARRLQQLIRQGDRHARFHPHRTSQGLPPATPQHRQWAENQRETRRQERLARREARRPRPEPSWRDTTIELSIGLTPREDAPPSGQRSGSRSTRLGHVPRDTRSLEELMRGTGRRPRRQTPTTGPQPGLEVTYRVVPGEGFVPRFSQRRKVV